MSFDDTQLRRPAVRGDVGFNAYLVSHALSAIVAAMDKIAANSGVEISTELDQARADVRALQSEFDRLTGWQQG